MSYVHKTEASPNALTEWTMKKQHSHAVINTWAVRLAHNRHIQHRMSIDCLGPLFKILAKFLFWTWNKMLYCINGFLPTDVVKNGANRWNSNLLNASRHLHQLFTLANIHIFFAINAHREYISSRTWQSVGAQKQNSGPFCRLSRAQSNKKECTNIDIVQKSFS